MNQYNYLIVLKFQINYTFQVFNNSTIDVNPKVAKVKKFFEGPIDDGYGMSVVLSPGGHSSNNFYKTKLYFDIKIP